MMAEWLAAGLDGRNPVDRWCNDRLLNLLLVHQGQDPSHQSFAPGASYHQRNGRQPWILSGW